MNAWPALTAVIAGASTVPPRACCDPRHAVARSRFCWDAARSWLKSGVAAALGAHAFQAEVPRRLKDESGQRIEVQERPTCQCLENDAHRLLCDVLGLDAVAELPGREEPDALPVRVADCSGDLARLVALACEWLRAGSAGTLLRHRER